MFNNKAKKIISGLMLPIILLGLFAVPINKARAEITNLTLTGPTNVVIGESATFVITAVGQPEGNENLYLYINNGYDTVPIDKTLSEQTITFVYEKNFKANTTYTAYAKSIWSGGGRYNTKSDEIEFTINEDGSVSNTNTGGGHDADGNSLNYDFNCGIGIVGESNLTGCVAWFLYIVWYASSWIARIGGAFLDFFVFYSIDSSSYQSSFVNEGWGIVRDVANIFFIVALMFIAIKTVLNLNASNNKRLVVTLVIAAMLINFSLFTSRVIVDAGNILAKIFYNKTIAKDANGNVITGNSGERSISLGLIKEYNPQKIVDQDIYDQGNEEMFIVVAILAIAITVYTAILFFKVALLFLARVATIWILMIFSPIAFASYALPFKIPGFGKDEWWDQLLKNVFLAPIFVFFLYITIQFIGALNIAYTGSGGNTNEDKLRHIMSVVIPFALIYVILTQAKDIAITYSGKMGAAINKAGSFVGGAAIGLATGGLAMAARGTVGALASKMSQSENLKEKANQKGLGGMMARMQLRTADKLQKNSFDIRNTKLAAGLGQTGLNMGAAATLGAKVQQGGFQAMAAKKAQRMEEERELYKTSMSDDEVRLWSAKKRAEYMEKRNSFHDPDEYDKVHGGPPTMYNSADELNAERMTAYKNNMGTKGVLGNFAKMFTKEVTAENFEKSKEYEKILMERERDKAILADPDSFNQNDFERDFKDRKDRGEFSGRDKFDQNIADQAYVNNAKKVKMRLGAAAVIAGGVLTGGAALSLGGGVLGAGIATGTAGFHALGNTKAAIEAESKVASSIAKEISGLTKITERIEATREQLEAHKNTKAGASALGLITINAKGKEIVDKGKVNDMINDIEIDIKNYENDMEDARKAGNTALVDTIKTRLKDKLNERGKLNSLKDIDDKINSAEQRLYDLTGKKSSMGKKPSSGGGSSGGSGGTP